MRRSIVVLAMTIVFVLAMASAALAGPPEHGQGKFGKGIIAHCGMPYGQFVKDSPHESASGAKAFIITMATNSEAAAIHGCVFPD
jgi:hypothetical protein